MRKFMHALGIATLVLALAGVAVADTFNVSIGDSFYSPADLAIHVGDMVVWTNNGLHQHTVDQSMTDMSCDVFPGGFSSGTLNPGDSYNWTATSASDIYYHCMFHCPSMAARLTVEDGVAAEPSSWSTIKSLYR